MFIVNPLSHKVLIFHYCDITVIMFSNSAEKMNKCDINVGYPLDHGLSTFSKYRYRTLVKNV